jgi:hypothetical protein
MYMAKDLRIRLDGEDLRKLYLDEKKSLEDIARLYGVSRVAVWKYCKACGFERRNRSEARLEAQKKGKVPQNYFNINEAFFSKWGPEMAYVFGLLITDGCLSKVKSGSYKVSLCLNDRDLLEKVAKTMESSHAVTPSKYQRGLHLLMFAREKLTKDLLRLGLKPRKSLDIKFPDVPKEYLTDFIRGVFDGDGSVFFEKRSPRLRLRSKFISGSKQFIETLENKLRLLGMPKRNIYEQKTKNGILYMFIYCHKDSSKLFRILYKGIPGNGLFLRRKYYKFLSGLK